MQAVGPTAKGVLMSKYDALRDYLARARSPYELGEDLFGRHTSGRGDLSARRRDLYARLTDAKRRARG